MNCRLAAEEPVTSTRLVSQHLEKALGQVKKYEAWAAGFPETLAQAKRGSYDVGDKQLVWQDELVEFWEPFTIIQRDLYALYDEVRDVNAALADMIDPYIDPPSRAQIEYATEGAHFLDRPGYARKQIAYEVRRLEVWHRNFGHWVRGALQELQVARREI